MSKQDFVLLVYAQVLGIRLHPRNDDPELGADVKDACLKAYGAAVDASLEWEALCRLAR